MSKGLKRTQKEKKGCYTLHFTQMYMFSVSTAELNSFHLVFFNKTPIVPEYVENENREKIFVQLVMQASTLYTQSKHTHQNTIQIKAYHHPGEQEKVQPSVPLRAHELKVIKAKAKSYCSLFRGMTRYDACYQQNTKQ